MDYYVFTDFETTGVEPENEDVPIEIGMLITDDEYNIVDTYSDYINPFQEDTLVWDEKDVEAFKVHKIPREVIHNVGKRPEEIVENIRLLLLPFKNASKQTRFIIVSDNAQFEYNFMRKLYTLAGIIEFFPFHYSAWDVNILINSVQKVQKGRMPHKAIQDIFKTYKAVIRALERNGFRKWEK